MDIAQDIFEVLQHIATYPAIRIVASQGTLTFLLPTQTEEDLEYLRIRHCVPDAKGQFIVAVGTNLDSSYAKWLKT
jgi:hypothetical protein